MSPYGVGWTPVWWEFWSCFQSVWCFRRSVCWFSLSFRRLQFTTPDFDSEMPPNGPDEWRARIGHWENRKLRWYQVHCRSRPRVPLYLRLERVITEAPLLCTLLLLWLTAKVTTGACEAGNAALSSLGKLGRIRCLRHGKVCISSLLSLFVALSLLLLVAGDVETNPGPITRERKYCM